LAYRGAKQALEGMVGQADAFLAQNRFDDAERVIGQIVKASPNHNSVPALQQRLLDLRGS